MVALWMGVIFYASTDVFSAGHTSRFIEPVLRWLFRGRLSEAGVKQIHFLIRKFAHLSEYAVLALLTRNALRRGAASNVTGAPRLGEWSIAGFAFLIAATYAAGDEFHQTFVPSRGASVHDVMIDAAGAATGLLILQGYRRFRR